MPYIQNGQIKEQKGWSFMGLVISLVNIIRIFFLTIFTGETNDHHIKEYHSTKGKWFGNKPSGNRANINSFAKPAQAGCAGAGG